MSILPEETPLSHAYVEGLSSCTGAEVKLFLLLDPEGFKKKMKGTMFKKGPLRDCEVGV